MKIQFPYLKMFYDLWLNNQHRRHSKVTLSEVSIRERKLQQFNIDIIVTFHHRTAKGYAVVIVSYTPREGFKNYKREKNMILSISPCTWVAEDGSLLVRAKNYCTNM